MCAQRFETAAWGDANMRTLQKRSVIQLERKGYFIVDQPLLKANKPIVLFAVPDGKAKALMSTPAPKNKAAVNAKA